MKNFNWVTFTKQIAISASLPTLYKAWTQTSEIEKWFLSKALFFDEADALLSANASIQKGYHYAWSWYLFDVEEKGDVTEANGKDFLQFTFAGKCLVDVNFKQVGDQTLVSLTQKNIPTDDASKRGIRLGCESGWSFFMLNLKSVYEGGIDLRNKDPQLKGMLNN